MKNEQTVQIDIDPMNNINSDDEIESLLQSSDLPIRNCSEKSPDLRVQNGEFSDLTTWLLNTEDPQSLKNVAYIMNNQEVLNDGKNIKALKAQIFT